ncbi:MAG: hypothetical protein GY821_06190 [Gammaproteobacteria bacterium]|nr:hypothetical protein [Gammaproteobacteria bacterium]
MARLEKEMMESDLRNKVRKKINERVESLSEEHARGWMKKIYKTREDSLSEVEEFIGKKIDLSDKKKIGAFIGEKIDLSDKEKIEAFIGEKIDCYVSP